MNRHIIRMLLVTLLLAPHACFAQQFDPNLATHLQAVLDSMRVTERVPGISAAVLLPGRAIWQGTAGGARQGVPVDRAMVFGIGSNSKLFTAAAVLTCSENGWLNLDDALARWLPAMNNVDSTITIRQLLHHTSGLADVNEITGYPDSILADPRRMFTREEVLSWIGSPHFAPGTSWRYSNTNYLLAGMIVEKASGKSFAAFLRDSVLAPLQLDSTVLSPDETLVGSIADPWANGVNISSTPRMSLHSTAWCAGAMYSTSAEMVQWYAALFDGRVLQPSSMREMTTFVGSGAYGCGIAEKRVGGRLVWVHGGSIRGYTSQMMYDTSMHAVLCVLTNETPGSASAIAQQLLAVLAASTPTSVAEIPAPAPSLTVYPNPARSSIAVRTAHPTPVHIHDLLGREVWRGVTHETTTIGIAHWSPGLYRVIAGRDAMLIRKW